MALVVGRPAVTMAHVGVTVEIAIVRAASVKFRARDVYRSENANEKRSRLGRDEILWRVRLGGTLEEEVTRSS